MSLFSFVIILTLQATTNNPVIDSLESRLNKAEGKEKVILLNELYKRYVNNNPVKALSYTRRALTLAEKINDPSGMASSYNNMGVLYKNQGSLDKALKSYVAALQIQEENGFTDALAYTYSNVGTVYSLQGDFENALEYFNKANDQFESINHNLRIIGSLNNIGNVYEAMGDYDRALDYYLKSLRIYEEIEDNSMAFVPLNNIGNIYFRKGDYNAAMAYYQSALDLEKFNNDINGQANALHNIGSVYRAQGETQKAIETFNDALNKAQETDNKRLLALIYQSLAEAYFTHENMLMAYSFLSLHTQAKDSMFAQQSSQQLANLESALELEQKEAEIENLTVQSELQALQLKNDKIIIGAIILMSVLGIGLTVVIYKENKVIKRNKKLVDQQKKELESKNKIIEEKNTSITQSIDYANSVQQSLLSLEMDTSDENHIFVLFRPKDIVSGDFFWHTFSGKNEIVVAADCTGHGVAGAFMTVVGMTALESIVKKDKVTEPERILSRLNDEVAGALNYRDGEEGIHGMDVAICKIDRDKGQLVFAGANRPLYYMSNGQLQQVKGTRTSIGAKHEQSYGRHEMPLGDAELFYLFSDGYVDQFGGPNDKKFMPKRFRLLLEKIYTLPLQEQKQKLEAELDRWKEDTSQTDDILVLGVKP
ncbi:MAG: tetratricopeptide repeat protein [Fulvivirga sp.]|nr:tetratricopeptide repeat protein [Fulvivirga sp.]